MENQRTEGQKTQQKICPISGAICRNDLCAWYIQDAAAETKLCAVAHIAGNLAGINDGILAAAGTMAETGSLFAELSEHDFSIPVTARISGNVTTD